MSGPTASPNGSGAPPEAAVVLRRLKSDILIVGTGPIGAGFARVFLDEKVRLRPQGSPLPQVIMVDVGQQLSVLPGENLKNSFYYQRNVNNFTPIVQGTLQAISISPNSVPLPYPIDPNSFMPQGQSFIINNINGNQDANLNLPAAATTYAIGGMATHWTCCTPQTAVGVERPDDSYGITNDEWERLYSVAEEFFKTNREVFDDSLRQQVLLEELTRLFGERAQKMPIAAIKNARAPELIVWSGTDTVFGPLLQKDGPFGINKNLYDMNKLRILPQHRCTRLYWTDSSSDPKKPKKKITGALVRDLQADEDIIIEAKIYIIAANSILTPQILFNSDIASDESSALGRYLMDQQMTFCQILLSDAIVDAIAAKQKEQEAKLPEPLPRTKKIHGHAGKVDPVPIPITDPIPALILKVTEDHPWHVQIHKDTFSYGMVPQSIDPRLVLDLRWFGRMEADKKNRVKFERNSNDLMGMPQPTFLVELSPKDKILQHTMMTEMCTTAMALGGYLPGAEPRCMPAGTALHIQGTTRYGNKDDGTSVCDSNSRVWETENCYCGGNNLIPTSIACNPTLTSLAIAIKSAAEILRILNPTNNKPKKPYQEDKKVGGHSVDF